MKRFSLLGGVGLVLALTVLVLAAGAVAMATDSDDKVKGAKDGSHAIVYSVTIQETVTGINPRDEEWKFTTEAFDVPGDDMPRRKVFVSKAKEDGKGPSLPLVAMQYRPKDSRPLPDVSNITERAVNEAFWRLVKGDKAVPASRLDAEGDGDDRIKILGVQLGRKKVPVTYSTKPQTKNPELLDYKVNLKAPYSTTLGSTEMKVDEYSERWVFDNESKRFLGAQWRSKVSRTTRGQETTRELRIQVIEDSRRPLTEAEVASVSTEFKLLLPVVRVLLPGFASSADKDDVMKKFKQYKSGYGEGVLSGALAELDTRFMEKAPEIGQLPDPDARAEELMNKAAPAFKLESLSGGEVSLESLKGKVVVIQFWSLM